MNDEKYNDEYNHIVQLLKDSSVSEKKIELIESVIENVVWMKIKLEETRSVVKNSSVVIPYDNGGGQKGIRENPIFKGYESLFKSYMSGMTYIFNLLPKEVAIEEEKEVVKVKSVLDEIREKHGLC